MRIIGGSDYYDGTAFRSDGTVLSLLVLRRDLERSESRAWMRSALGTTRNRLRLRLSPCDDGPGPAVIPHRLLRGGGSIARVRWNGSDLRIDEGGALFCGTMRRSVLIRTEHAWSARRSHVEAEWCWSADDLECALAAQGLRMEDDWNRSWFDPVHVADRAKHAGLCIATMDPTAGDGTNAPWRIDAPTLGGIGFERVLPASDALARLADWIGGVPSGRDRTRLRATPSRAAVVGPRGYRSL